MKKIISAVLLLAMLLSITACRTSPNSENEDMNVLYPITLTDQAGRSVTIEQ